MMKIVKLLIGATALAFLSGCTSPLIKPADAELSYFNSENPVSSEHQLYNGVTVETTGFLETSSSYLKNNSTANLNNEGSKDAIEMSLREAGMLDKFGNGNYTLKATLVDSDIGNIFTVRLLSRDMIINYKLIEEDTREILYNKTIKSTSKGKFKLITINYYADEKELVERAFKKNFEQLINDLKEL